MLIIRIVAGIVFVTAFAFAQQDHDALLNQHGVHEMGFSHEKTTHHVELHYDGGAIEVRADDIKDTASRDEIRSHFRHIAQMFAAGSFNVPMLVHTQEVPGTAAITALKNQIHWNLQETARGARINVVADNKPALSAVHEFLRFQIADHKTGDCTAVR